MRLRFRWTSLSPRRLSTLTIVLLHPHWLVFVPHPDPIDLFVVGFRGFDIAAW
jgi:hypothetical protein